MTRDQKKLLFLITVWVLAFILVAWAYKVEGQITPGPVKNNTAISIAKDIEDKLTRIKTEGRDLQAQIEAIKRNNPITYYFEDENPPRPYPNALSLAVFGNPHYGETSKRLGQFRDNFVNETYIAGKHQVHRNATLGCIELDLYNASTAGVVMDLWTGTDGGFTEVDPGGDHVKKVNNTYVQFDDVDRDEGDRLYKDYGANFFDTSFHYYFRVKIPSSHTDNARCYFMAFSEEALSIYDTRNNLKNYCGFFVWYKSVSARWELELRMFNSTVPQDYGRDIETEDDSLDMNKLYHVDYVRDGTNVSAWFYNDALMTDLDFLLTLDVKDCDNLRYFHPLNAENQATGGRAMDLNLHSVYNETAGNLVYRPDGLFYTTDYLAGPIANGISLALMTNATQEAVTSISVQISPDNVTWYNSHNVSGYDTIVDGFQSLDLRYLNLTSKIYFRYNFTRGANPLDTPRLYQSRILTSIGLGGGGTATTTEEAPYFGLAIILLLIGLMIGSRIRR